MKQQRKTTLHTVLLFQLFILILLISFTFASFIFLRKAVMLERWCEMMQNWKCENVQLLN